MLVSVPPETPELPPELLYNIVTWVIAQSVHSICISDDDVEWELKLMETLCLVSSAFRDITLEVACKAFAIEREENPLNYSRSVHNCRPANMYDFSLIQQWTCYRVCQTTILAFTQTTALSRA